jgi:hypothetical protein
VFVRRSQVVDDFQLMTIIAEAISTCAIESRSGETLPITSEQATCVAKVVITALSQAGLEIRPIARTADPT